MGYSGTGTFTQSGGTNSISYSLYLGYNAGSSGSVQPQRQRPVVVGLSSTWATPARGPSRSPAGPTASARFLISATTPAAAARTTSAAAASCRHAIQIRRQFRHGDLHADRRDQHGHGRISYLGNNTGGSGIYSLSGSGQLHASPAICTWASPARGPSRRSGGTNTLQLAAPVPRQQRRQRRHVQPQRQRPVVGPRRIRRLLPGTAPSRRPAAPTRSRCSRSAAAALTCFEGGVLQVNGSLLEPGGLQATACRPLLSADNSILDLSGGTWPEPGRRLAEHGAIRS